MAKVLTPGAAGAGVEAARDTLAGAVALAGRLPADAAVGLLTAARGAFVDAFAVTALLGAGLAVAGIAVALTSMRGVGKRAGSAAA
jgi:MFS transporter, DHA2 family, multidrug resistance protein